MEKTAGLASLLVWLLVGRVDPARRGSAVLSRTLVRMVPVASSLVGARLGAASGGAS